MSHDHNKYNAWQGAKQAEWESMCRNCGVCCGAGEDPCEHLQQHLDGKFFCDTYHNRFGAHRTVSGVEMMCVSIRSKLALSWPGDERCGYKKAS